MQRKQVVPNKTLAHFPHILNTEDTVVEQYRQKVFNNCCGFALDDSDLDHILVLEMTSHAKKFLACFHLIFSSLFFILSLHAGFPTLSFLSSLDRKHTL